MRCAVCPWGAGKLGRLALLLFAAACGSGCTATLERTNRGVYVLNDVLDVVVLKPLSSVYTGIIPSTVRAGISNAVDNVQYLDTVLNTFLQGKNARGWGDLARFLVNSTLGLGGLLDVAHGFGLEQHQEDFGQTLAVWGVDPGPYLVLPLLGPSTLRDAWRYPIQVLTDPIFYLSEVVIVPASAAQALDQRARAAEDIRIRDESALDPYVFTREAYLEQRAFLVVDGVRPIEELSDELDDLLDELGDF